MNQPTKEQIQWLWEQCGVEFYESDGRFWARTPSGGTAELLVDLNNLFEYAVPKLQSINRGFVLCDSQGKLPYHVEIYTYNTMFGEAHAGFEQDDDPALALFWATYKAFGGKE